MENHTLDAWRFREGKVCWWCNREVRYGKQYKGDPLQATREHVIPKSEGGSGARSNIVVACARCNTVRRSDMRWVPFHQLNMVSTLIPLRQWQLLVEYGQLPETVERKKQPV